MNTAELLQTATQAIDAAIDALASAGDQVLSDEGRDIKMQADLDAEAAMLRVLREAGDVPVLSEEAGADEDFAVDATGWVVDPLDGTANFARGIPMACTCLAFLRQGRPVLGAIHDHHSGERWAGGADAPTTCNCVPVHCSTIDDPARGILSTGFPRSFEFTPTSIEAITRRFAAFKKIRMIGCAGLSLAWTAGGRIDLHMESGTFLWDVAAGLALVEGAGGAVKMSTPDGHWRCDVAAGASGLVAGLDT